MDANGEKAGSASVVPAVLAFWIGVFAATGMYLCSPRVAHAIFDGELYGKPASLSVNYIDCTQYMSAGP